jgi:hypothetical protein
MLKLNYTGMNKKYNSYYEEQMRQAEARVGHKLTWYEDERDSTPITGIRVLTDHEQIERCSDIDNNG